ncbi:hypothetical protein GOODEAATRI_019433 [Goodea atripinnis]|uniref:Ral GTPase-activating protein subunit alpha/beta N-terminal domain-containing protein n=1 Tax=Goodea atripinnis TaxID=208336 RepID=A0ABV0PZY3_9TELE
MEVLCYGLSLPLDRNTVKLCVDVYTDWMMALVSQPSSTPLPISRDPNLYVQRILRHLYILFLPRSDQVSPFYLSICQQVLGSVQSLARETSVMSRETWETLLHFLLRINHIMLAPPAPAGGISDLFVVVLLDVWLLACSRCFPSRSLWQTFRQMFSSWRHQPVVVEHWKTEASGCAYAPDDYTTGPSIRASPPKRFQEDQTVSFCCCDADLTFHLYGVLLVTSICVSIWAVVEIPGLTAGTHFRDRVPSLGKHSLISPLTFHIRSFSVGSGELVRVTVILYVELIFVPLFPPGFCGSRGQFRDRLPPYGKLCQLSGSDCWSQSAVNKTLRSNLLSSPQGSHGLVLGVPHPHL